MEQAQYYGTGRRKTSVARVRLVPGSGNVTINEKAVNDFFGMETLETIVKQPLKETEVEGKFDVIANVEGGGFTGQAEAVRHGIARALLKADNEFRPILKKNGFLTRDDRKKERKKYGRKKARKSPQFSKR